MSKHLTKEIHSGTNIFGQSCIAKTVMIHPETGLQQYLAVLADVEAHIGDRIEYTLEHSQLTQTQYLELQEDLRKAMQLRFRFACHSNLSRC